MVVVVDLSAVISILNIIEMMEEIQKIGWQKLAVGFIYLCVQFLVFASLMLTTTSMAVHVILIAFVIVFYFMTVFKEPGTYVGVHEPNHEDVECSGAKSDKSKKSGSRKKPTASQTNINVRQEWGKEATQERGSSKKMKKTRVVKKKKARTTVEFAVKIPVESVDLPDNEDKSESQGATFQIFAAAKNAFGNITNLMSKSEPKDSDNEAAESSRPQLDDKIIEEKKEHEEEEPEEKTEYEEEEQGEQEGENHQEKEKQELPPAITLMIPDDPNFPPMGKENKVCSAIEKSVDFDNVNEMGGKEPEYNMVAKKMLQKKRYCRICEVYQPLRVKHCHSCEKCIPTFDHHCPWMGNCIGEKNKLYYTIFLLFQTLQTFIITFDLIIFLAAAEADNKSSVGILLMVIILLFVVLATLLGFHMYLVAINLTIWEYLRWEKIEYLLIFDKTKLASPFSKGIKENLMILWEGATTEEHKKWIDDISEDLSQYRKRRQAYSKSAARPADSDRRPFRSMAAVVA